MTKFLFLTILLMGLSLLLQAESLTLAQNGKTSYTIFCGNDATEVDLFAVEELKNHLKAITNASFSAETKPGKKTIFVGLTPEAKKILGKDAKMDSLQDQESIIQTKNSHLFLYGKGRHGNLYAVYELLENVFGCRWLSGFTKADFIPVKKTLTIARGTRKSHYAIPKRSIMNWFYRDKNRVKLYAYRNRQNLLLNIGTPQKGILQFNDFKGPGCHVLSVIFPGFKGRYYNSASKLFKGKNYFAAHPEWFSMDEKGKRVNNRQLCFSNKALQKELTKNLFIFYKNLEKRHKAKFFYTLDLNDIAYNMCHCKECQVLQKKYQTPGGSFFDYLFKLCNAHPEIEFATLAYQKDLTQIPPVNYQSFPKNLTVIFAPINGVFSGTLDKENLRDRKDLEGWLKLTPRVWIWYYPNTYASKLPSPAPVANFERLASDIRTLARLKVDGTYFEHDSGGAKSGTNLSEMQSYVMYKLFQDPSLDEKKLMKDFALHFYGKAANEVLQFAFELEKCRKDFIARGGKWLYHTQNYHYLTEMNFLKWDALLEKAAKKVQGEYAMRIRLLRMGLDCCIINNLWTDSKGAALQKKCRERILLTAEEIDKYLRPVSSMRGSVKKFLAAMDERGTMKPIPKELLAKYAREDIALLLPNRNTHSKYRAKDPDANLKFALVEPWNGKKFTLGTYSPGTKKYGPGRIIIPAHIVKGKYALYKLNSPVILTPDIFLWGGKWRLVLNMGQHFKHDVPESLKQKWDVYVSLKFTHDKVYMDRGFLVKVKK